MSRLLHAAARGARIEYKRLDGYWEEADSLCSILKGTNDYRIHPDDTHLQYGPISTALREIALTGDREDSTIPYLTIGVTKEASYWGSSKNDRRVFLLILAEALAEEGL